MNSPVSAGIVHASDFLQIVPDGGIPRDLAFSEQFRQHRVVGELFQVVKPAAAGQNSGDEQGNVARRSELPDFAEVAKH